MYLDLFKLHDLPFRLSPDPQYLYLSRNHSRAKAYMESTIWFTDGFVVITGEIGSGKTTLIETFLRELEQDVVVAQVNQTQVSALEFLQSVLVQFGFQPFKMRKAELLATLNQFLIEQYAAGRKVLLIVDEAQNLTPRAVEELRMLSNFQFGKQALLQTFLVGQPEFREILQHPNMQQLRQRVTATCHIGPLDVEETRGYIEHRLKCAGGTGKPEFGDGVFEAIFKATGGIPRRINSVCDRLLLLGFLGDKERLTLEDVDEVVNELHEEGGAGAARLVSSRAPLEHASHLGVADELVDIDLAKLQQGIAPFADSLSGQLSNLSAEHQGDRLQRLERSLMRLERVNLEILSMLQKMVAAVRR